MRVLADTSVLVAAMVEAHPAHERALRWLQGVLGKEIEFCVSAHTLAELYAVLTSLPVRPRIQPATARRLIRENVESVATVIELRAKDYREVLDDQASLALSGGTTYDALIARAARKAGAEELVTLNPKDFRRVCPDDGPRIAVV